LCDAVVHLRSAQPKCDAIVRSRSASPKSIAEVPIENESYARIEFAGGK